LAYDGSIMHAAKRSNRRDRYDTSGNSEAEYVDAAGTVLRNKQGFTELQFQCAEEESLAKAYELLFGEVRVDTKISVDLVRYIHGLIFGELFNWAGRWRTVNISKHGISWPPPIFIPENMDRFQRDVLDRYTAASVTDDDGFCRAVAIIHGEFLVIHPFREGNARTIKLATDLLAAQTGRPLLKYDQSEEGRERYIVAARISFRRDYRLMTEVIRQALHDARQ
jgi:cell filamentation protein